MLWRGEYYVVFFSAAHILWIQVWQAHGITLTLLQFILGGVPLFHISYRSLLTNSNSLSTPTRASVTFFLIILFLNEKRGLIGVMKAVSLGRG